MSTAVRRPGQMAREDGRSWSTPATTVARADPAYQAFVILRIGFALLPIVSGIDKYFNKLTYWPQYLADWIDNIVPGSPQQFMYVAGAIEIVAGVLVAVRPRYGAYLVAAWLGGIVVNLLSYGEWYDVALRDAGLMVGALALARLAARYDRIRRTI